MPTVPPKPPTREQLERERIQRERNKILEEMDPETGPNEPQRRRLEELEEEERKLDGKPPPPAEDPDAPWSDPEEPDDKSAGSSSSSGSGSGDGDQGDHPDGPQETPGSDVVTGKGRANVPVRHAAPTLHDAVTHRLGGVIDEGDVIKQVIADPALRARLAGESDVVHPGDLHPPHPRDHDLPGRVGDPRTGGAVDPPENDDDPKP